MKQKTALVLGAGGFIASHMATQLKKENYFVRGVDLKYPEFSKTSCDEFIIGDLRDTKVVEEVMSIRGGFSECYQYAEFMGGATFIFTGDNDADIIESSHLINANIANCAIKYRVGKLFYSSSACIYPLNIQEDVDNKGLKESDAFPANCDSDYGFAKLSTEKLYMAYHKNYDLDIRIARFHNIFGVEGTWDGIKAKAPASIARKVAIANNFESIEILGDGLQTRSFLDIQECTQGVRKLMNSNFTAPINIGSDEMISINDLAKMVIGFSGKNLVIKNVESNALGVRGRNSDNTLCESVLGWKPTQPLEVGMRKLYEWVNSEVQKNKQANG